MSEFSEPGYLFLQSFQLNEKEVRAHLNEKINKIEIQENVNLKPYKIFINVVKNKNDEHLGYSYVWTDKKEIYNLFSSLNLDGSIRMREYEDPDWVPPEEKEANQSDWASLIEAENDQKCPMIKEYLPPLTDIEHYTPGDYLTRIGPMYINKIGKNAIYSRNLEDWITEKVLRYHLAFFEKDKRKYKNNYSKKLYNYPIINMKNNTATIIFSPKHPFTASFLIHVIKKIKIKHNNNEKLIFFSQSKN